MSGGPEDQSQGPPPAAGSGAGDPGQTPQYGYFPQGGAQAGQQAQPAAAGGSAPQFVQSPPHQSNGLAVASIITSSISLGVLMLTVGLASPLTAVASVVGTVLGHKGKLAVDRGEAAQQRELATAGFWVGVAGIALSVLALLAWVALIVGLILLDDSSWVDELGREFDQDWDQY